MPNDPQIKQLVKEASIFLKTDQNRPYTVRRRKKGQETSRGEADQAFQWDTRTIENIRSQPLGEKELNRLPEGLKHKTWRFFMVLPKNIGGLPVSRDEMLDFEEQVQYNGRWFEIQKINDWDLIQHANGLMVE